MSDFQNTLLHASLGMLWQLSVFGSFTVPYFFTRKTRRYTEPELKTTREQYRGIGGRLLVTEIWMLVAISVAVLLALWWTDAGSRGDGTVELGVAFGSIMVVSLFQAGFALWTNVYPTLSLKPLRLKYIFDSGSRVKIVAVCQVLLALLQPVAAAFWVISA